MIRGRHFLLTLLLAFVAPFALAQIEVPGEPPGGDPLAPGGEMAQPAEVPEVAWVRLAHFSPNAGDITVQLAPSDEEATFSGEGFDQASYQSMTDYIEVPSGSYNVSTQVQDMTVEEEFNFGQGNHYTLAVVGLLPPPEAQTQAQEGEQDGGGIGGFFRNLFGQGESGDALALQFQLYEDDVTGTAAVGESVMRIVHAAPGTERVDLAVTGEQGTLANVAFGDASRYVGVEGSLDNLEVRLSGSQAATISLSDANLQPGNVNTIYVVGTPVQQAPLTLLGSSIAPVGPGTPVTEDVAVSTWSTAPDGTTEPAQDDMDDADMDTEPAEEDAASEDPAAPADDAAAGEDADAAPANGAEDADAAGESETDTETEEPAQPEGEEPAQPEGEDDQAQ